MKTLEELEQRRKEILQKAYSEYEEAYDDYLDNTITIKIGDTIEDHIGKGIVKDIKYHTPNVVRGGLKPSFVCICDNLTKKGTINKREPLRKIYSSNIII